MKRTTGYALLRHLTWNLHPIEKNAVFFELKWDQSGCLVQSTSGPLFTCHQCFGRFSAVLGSTEIKISFKIGAARAR